MLIIAGIGLVVLVALWLFLAMCFRIVVPTNDTHIVQSAKSTTSYGKGEAAGNTYYKWPSWVPRFGVKTIVLPVSVFDVDLDAYAAYDKGRVPFQVDVMAFFRITDSNMAAQRVHNYEELKLQLQGVLQGACRTILAQSEIEEILEGRGKFGEMFTKEVDLNLSQWGVQSVKQIELMDIRDAHNSKVIENIMAKKKSLIEMQSRTEVANNIRTAQLAEIAAKQEVQTREQEAIEKVGIRTAEKDQRVGISNEQAKQEVYAQAATTAQRQMAIQQVNDVRAAEIEKDVQVVAAEQEKRKTIIVAEGQLEQARLNAQGIELEGKAKGVAEQAVLMAPVNTQIELAREIGSNAGYQTYLVQIRQIEAVEEVGIKQAEALKAAEIKVIANGGNVPEGMKSVLDLFSAKGGTAVASMVEAAAQMPVVGQILKKVNGEGRGAE